MRTRSTASLNTCRLPRWVPPAVTFGTIAFLLAFNYLPGDRVARQWSLYGVLTFALPFIFQYSEVQARRSVSRRAFLSGLHLPHPDLLCRAEILRQRFRVWTLGGRGDACRRYRPVRWFSKTDRAISAAARHSGDGASVSRLSLLKRKKASRVSVLHHIKRFAKKVLAKRRAIMTEATERSLIRSPGPPAVFSFLRYNLNLMLDIMQRHNHPRTRIRLDEPDGGSEIPHNALSARGAPACGSDGG